MPDRSLNRYYSRRLSDYGKEVQRKYDRREIGWAYYNKLMRKPKCWIYV